MQKYFDKIIEKELLHFTSRKIIVEGPKVFFYIFRTFHFQQTFSDFFTVGVFHYLPTLADNVTFLLNPE